MIRFVPRNFDAVNAYFKSLPRGVGKVAGRAYVTYIVGNTSHGLKHYDPYKHITIKRAYGGFSSEKQRRFVMASIKDGRIDPGAPHRTGKGQRAWEISETTRGFTIKNNEPSMYFSKDDKGQANLNRLVGWDTVSKDLADNQAGAEKAANAAVRAFLEKR